MISYVFLLTLLSLSSALLRLEPHRPNQPRCGNSDGNRRVFRLTDGFGHPRCFTLIAPNSTMDGTNVTRRRAPILFVYHAHGDNAESCGLENYAGLTGRNDSSGESLLDLSRKHGFAIVCPEALQDRFASGGEWDIPEKQTTATGTKCHRSESVDLLYMDRVINQLKAVEVADTYNLNVTQFYSFGVSLGAAFSAYISVCLHQYYYQNDRSAPVVKLFPAFATHSTGLKMKGDGRRFPNDYWVFQIPGDPDPRKALLPAASADLAVPWGECEGCQYYPIVPSPWIKGLKACVFDNIEDGEFFLTNIQLALAWAGLDHPVEFHVRHTPPGLSPHGDINSYALILSCLDDNTGNLLSADVEPFDPAKVFGDITNPIEALEKAGLEPSNISDPFSGLSSSLWRK